MREAARHRLLSSVRVSMLVIAELREAQQEGRACPSRVLMRRAAEWAERELRDVVWNYYEGRGRRGVPWP